MSESDIPKINIDEIDKHSEDKEAVSEYEYHSKKLPNRTYTSRRIINRNVLTGDTTNLRIVSKVIDQNGVVGQVKQWGEVVLRTTPSGRQEIVAKVFEDTKNVFLLTIQRFTKENGAPHKIYFSFLGSEIKKLKDFIDSIPLLDFSGEQKLKTDDETLRKIKKFIQDENDPDLAIWVAQNVKKSDAVALAYRREQLLVFGKLLSDPSFFSQKKIEWDKIKDEDVWQYFFEKNAWIFGYGLRYIFNEPLQGEKLEQVVQGADIASKGKRADAFMKTRGVVSSVCLVEIKTHLTPLLQQVVTPYRPGCWRVSDDLNGGVVQCQKTIQATIKNLNTKFSATNKDGSPTGEEVFTYQPKSFMIVGNLAEFETEYGVNEEKYSSFELFRRNMISPEIITFDELYERAKFIVLHNEEDEIENVPLDSDSDNINLPF